jgi:hypothetical protein
MAAIILPDKWLIQPTRPVAINESVWPGRAQAFLPSLGYNGVISSGQGSGRIVTLQNANAPFTLRKNGEVVHAYRPNTSTELGESFKWSAPDFDVGGDASMVFRGYCLLANYGAALSYGGDSWGLLIDISDSGAVKAHYVDNPTTAAYTATLSGQAPAEGVPIAVGLIKSGATITVVTQAGRASTTGGNGGIRRSAGSGLGVSYNDLIWDSYCALMLGAVSSVAISIPQMQEILRQPYAIFRKQPRILYFTAPSGGGATITGSGTPTAQSSTVAGTAERSVTGTGTPTAQASAVAGVAERVITSSGTPTAQSSTVSGTGTVGGAFTGSGTLQAQSATVSGTAERSVTGTGAPASQAATVSGTAERVVTGTGTPTSQSSTVSGTGQVGNVVTGSGSPTAQAATVSGTAERTVTSSGALSAQSSTVAGTAERTITGSGALSAQSSTVYGFDSTPVDTGVRRIYPAGGARIDREINEWFQKNEDTAHAKRLMREDEELVLILLALAA